MKRIFLVLFLVTMIFTGCQSDNSDNMDGVEQTNSSTRTIEHAMGSTEVPTEPQRVVTLTNESTEAMLALGITPVGAVNSWVGDPFYDYMSEDLENTTPIGLEGDVNLETIASLNPDLIIGTKQRDEENYEQLSMIAPTVFSEALRGNWKDNFSLYADAVNKVGQGDELINQYDQRINELSNELSKKQLLDQQITVLRFLDGATRLYLENSFSGVILTDLGFTMSTIPSEEGFAEEITKEQLPDIVGDTILYFTFIENESDAALTQEEDWINDPVFKNLQPVKDGQIYEVNDITWNTGGGIISANMALDDVDTYVQNN